MHKSAFFELFFMTPQLQDHENVSVLWYFPYKALHLRTPQYTLFMEEKGKSFD